MLKFSRITGVRIPDFVEGVVEIKGGPSPSSLRLYPRNTPEILINLANPIEGNIDGQHQTVKEITIQGSKTNYADAYHPKHCHFISIRFSINGYYKLLDIPQKVFTNNLVDVDDIIGGNFAYLIMNLRDASSYRKRAQILCQWLSKDIRRRDAPSQLLSDLIMTRLKQNPHLSVGQLAEQTGYTRKHLVHQFKEEAGLTIKEYQKINRLQRVRKSVSEREDVHWAEVAREHGFYDQSHLIRDFKRYTGCTPTDYLNRRELAKA